MPEGQSNLPAAPIMNARAGSARYRSDTVGARFPVSKEAADFRKRFYPRVSRSTWNDWRWQMRGRIKSLTDLAGIFTLSLDEREALERHSVSLPVGITPSL